MKANAAEKQPASSEVDITFRRAAASSNKSGYYAKELRALGKALENLNLSSVDLELKGGEYVVRGKARVSQQTAVSFSKVVWDLICGASSSFQKKDNAREILLRYSSKEIEQLDCEGRAMREKAKKMPDPYNLSQILRGAGSYLDKRKETSLIRITIKDQSVTMRYKTADGEIEQTQNDLIYFYEYGVKAYLRRSNRPKGSPPSDPTLIVTREGLRKRSA